MPNTVETKLDGVQNNVYKRHIVNNCLFICWNIDESALELRSYDRFDLFQNGYQEHDLHLLWLIIYKTFVMIRIWGHGDYINLDSQYE